MSSVCISIDGILLPARFGCLAVCVCSPFPSLQATVHFPSSVHRTVALFRNDHQSSVNIQCTSVHALIQNKCIFHRATYIHTHTGCPIKNLFYKEIGETVIDLSSVRILFYLATICNCYGANRHNLETLLK